MQRKRLPTAKYARQLRTMADQLNWFMYGYLDTATMEKNQVLADRLEGRAFALHDAIEHIHTVEQDLRRIPRIS